MQCATAWVAQSEPCSGGCLGSYLGLCVEAERDTYMAAEGVSVGLQGQGGTYHGCCLSAVRAVSRLDVDGMSKGLASH